jgi:probable phosphoglycerate mutase
MTEVSGPGPEPEGFRQRRFETPHGATDLLLIRHGESEPYREGSPFPLVDGQGDPALSAEGAVQAEQLCARLAPVRIDAIYVTTLRRTAQTAAPLARALSQDMIVEAGLREVFLGDWEGGVLRKMVAANHPTNQQVIAEERWDVIPGAESNADLASRVRAAISRMAASHPGQRVAAFTHGGIIAQALALASGSRPFAFLGAENASISRLVIAGDRWIVRGFNDIAHLGRL